MYLLDTPVLAELRKGRSGNADSGLIAWAGGVPRHSMFMSVLSLVELNAMAAGSGRTDTAAGDTVAAWVTNQVLPTFEGRVLPIDIAVANRRAGLSYADNRDGLMAATALEHGLTLVTRNVAAFRSGRVKLFNPWGFSPEDDDGDWRQAARSGPQWFKNLFLRI
jgi:toxin FitB